MPWTQSVATTPSSPRARGVGAAQAVAGPRLGHPRSYSVGRSRNRVCGAMTLQFTLPLLVLQLRGQVAGVDSDSSCSAAKQRCEQQADEGLGANQCPESLAQLQAGAVQLATTAAEAEPARTLLDTVVRECTNQVSVTTNYWKYRCNETTECGNCLVSGCNMPTRGLCLHPTGFVAHCLARPTCMSAQVLTCARLLNAPRRS